MLIGTLSDCLRLALSEPSNLSATWGAGGVRWDDEPDARVQLSLSLRSHSLDRAAGIWR